MTRLGGNLRWVPSPLQTADSLTKINDSDFLRFLMEGGEYQIQSEEEALRIRAEKEKERLARGARRAEEAERKSMSQETNSEERNAEGADS